MYYNTTNLKGDALKESHAKAESQEALILAFFREHPDKMFIPDEVYSIFDPTKTPITSIRRSITDLTTDGHLTKTNLQKIGKYGKYAYCWRLSDMELNYINGNRAAGAGYTLTGGGGATAAGPAVAGGNIK